MKAFLFLCVLMGSSLTPGSAQEICTSGVCGCCLMDRHMHQTETYFNEMVDTIAEDLRATKKALIDIKASHSLFSAVLTDECISPGISFSTSTVHYDLININQGNNYNPLTGVFTAPLKGVYSFAVSIYNFKMYKSCADLKVNGEVVYMLRESRSYDMQDSASVFITMPLNAGDEVFVDRPPLCFLCASNNKFNTFTGFLLYPTA